MDKTKTDVLLHFVNAEDNTIVEARDVIQTLDYNTEQLDPFFKEYNVLQTETASAALASKQSSPEMVILLWLVGPSNNVAHYTICQNLHLRIS